MSTKDVPPVSVRLPPDLVERLDAAARQEDRTRSGQSTHILRNALAREAHRAEQAQLS